MVLYETVNFRWLEPDLEIHDLKIYSLVGAEIEISTQAKRSKQGELARSQQEGERHHSASTFILSPTLRRRLPFAPQGNAKWRTFH